MASEATLVNAWMQASGCHLSAVFLRQSQFLRDPEYVQLTSTSSVGSQLLPGFNSLTGALGMLFLGGPNPHLEYVNVLTLTMYFSGTQTPHLNRVLQAWVPTDLAAFHAITDPSSDFRQVQLGRRDALSFLSLHHLRALYFSANWPFPFFF